MKKTKYYLEIALFYITPIIVGCHQTTAPNDAKNLRGEPTLVCDTLVYDEGSKTFSLILHADSVADGKLTFYLLDGDSILMQNEEGQFSGIAPLEEGYNIQLRVEWSDTTVTTPVQHVLGFVIPREPVTKMTAEELQKLILSLDKSLATGSNEHLAQGVIINVIESKVPATTFQEVMMNLKGHTWKSVLVTNVNYDDNNLITSLTIKPEGEIVIEDEEEEIDY